MTEHDFSQIIYLPYVMNIVSRGFEPDLPDKDLKQNHVLTMVLLRNKSDLTMTEISRFLNLEKGSFTTIADRLVERGYVRRQRSEEDRRKVLLQLTDLGLATIAEADRQLIAHANQNFANLPPDVIETFLQALDTVVRTAQLVDEI